MKKVVSQEGLLGMNRKKEILKLLTNSGAVRVAQLSKVFGVTEETIRRDLEKLEAEGQLKRVHGGAVPLSESSIELPFLERTVKNIEQKIKIGQMAANYVNDRDIIALDSSSTCLELAKNIGDKKVSVLTNGFFVVQELGQKQDVSVLCTGGYYNADHHAFFGHSAENSIEGLHIGKLFLSCKGFDVNWGISESHEQQAMFKRKLLSIAGQVNLLVDSSKLNVKALIQTAPLEKIHRIITDNGIEDALVKSIENQGIEVVISN
ncbi:DeoR/GlpR family DNA-binding transcription regulator [Metabacillus sp. B2-18]|uniref:DeoR/GlpR family DNA-binding transcription regulator n=1 Tax=Metabacillus sp. B2-18 TaxID=2897333 RepID=UPI001E4BE32B|nr:DeoR/GlpR family DNA-binding transcription regulator [Metabacillus sp. B2-18]UGB29309.1 DeoR/GlpR family DNA-binding transcription regulator [Metabacillus sp. B2-18]